MADVRVRLNLRGINQVMTSPGVSARVEREAKRMADAAGPGFGYNVAPHRWTARAYVRPVTAAGWRRQEREAVLERVVGSRP